LKESFGLCIGDYLNVTIVSCNTAKDVDWAGMARLACLLGCVEDL